jgi:hypothetical protein
MSAAFNDILSDFDSTGADASLDKLAAFIQSDKTFYGSEQTTERLRSAHSTTPDYRNDKDRSVGVFFNILALHPHMKQFCTKVRCPVVGKDVPRLVMMLQGAITPAKIALLNAAIVWFQPNFRIKPKKSDVPEGFDFSVDLETADDTTLAYFKPQPSYVTKILKHLFSWTKGCGIAIEQKNFKGLEGSFQGVLKKIFKKRPNTGQTTAMLPIERRTILKTSTRSETMPCQSTISTDSEILLQLLVHYMLKLFMMRGAKEVCAE